MEATSMGKKAPKGVRLADTLRVPPGRADLSAHNPRATSGFDGDKAAGLAAFEHLGRQLSRLQERLYAQGRSGGRQSLLLVLQGMDTSGKGGTLRHVIGQVDPQGCAIEAFKAPTRQELTRGFLWRVRRRLPAPGMLGVFDRSHYEAILVERVHHIVPRATWSRRYGLINRFEAQLAENEMRVLKVFLHISKEEQRQRLLARLDNPAKRWKFNPRDIEERARWEEYESAYEDALTLCDSDSAPWFIVPADRKWYRNWAVARLLVEQLEDMKISWPDPTFDVRVQRACLLADS
jgi:PPK2 family polyphosphate:nucleotide phosphotransferase